MICAFWQGCPAEEAPKFSSRGNMVFSKLESFIPLLDHIWTTVSNVCTGTNERPSWGKERERRSGEEVKQLEWSFTLGMWGVSTGAMFFLPHAPLPSVTPGCTVDPHFLSHRECNGCNGDGRLTYLAASPCLPSSLCVFTVLPPFNRIKCAAFYMYSRDGQLKRCALCFLRKKLLCFTSTFIIGC